MIEPLPAVPTHHLLLTEEFVEDLIERLEGARRRVALQLMTFDGDAAGERVAGPLLAAAQRGVEVRVLVDSFALRVVSDQPVRRRAVRQEFARSLDLYRELLDGGVAVRFTNPNGPVNAFALARNHKKLFVVDDVVYLGGVNVSDHNFAWHDVMIRIDDRAVVTAVVDDFDVGFGGRRQVLDGAVVTNEAVEATFDALVRGAERRVVVASPYAVDRGLARLLELSAAAEKTVIVAAENNYRFLEAITPYVCHRLLRAGVDLATFSRFSHAKFVVADDRLLIGSSNFGRHSFWCNQEIGIVIDDPVVIDALLEEVGRARPIAVDPSRRRRVLGWAASAAMDAFLRLYARMIVPRVPLLHSPDGLPEVLARPTE